MIRLNIHEAKTHLCRYLKRLEMGETILLCKRNVPIAEIRPITRERSGRRPIGLAKGKFQVPPEFFEPLPNDVIDAFHSLTKWESCSIRAPFYGLFQELLRFQQKAERFFKIREMRRVGISNEMEAW